MKVTLDSQEAAMCHLAALMQLVKSGGVMGTTPHYNSRLTFHDRVAELAESRAAEWCVAKYLGYKYDPIENKGKDKADVGDNIEVRHTKWPDGQLIVYENDRVTDVAILVTGTAPNYYIAGWIPVAMAQKPRYRHSKQPTWWVTQINLQPIENLRKSSYGTHAI